MPLKPCPAREMLALPGQATAVWAVFDVVWYRATYVDARLELENADDADVLQFYLEYGQSRSHSPNIWFDEAWYIKAYPGVSAAVRDKQFESGFDEYAEGDPKADRRIGCFRR